MEPVTPGSDFAIVPDDHVTIYRHFAVNRHVVTKRSSVDWTEVSAELFPNKSSSSSFPKRTASGAATSLPGAVGAGPGRSRDVTSVGATEGNERMMGRSRGMEADGSRSGVQLIRRQPRVQDG